MMKHINLLKASAAAMAASLALAISGSAFAQPNTLAGAPRGQQQQQQQPPLFADQDFRGDRDRDWNDRDDRGRGNDDWRRRKPDFQTAQRDCSRAGIQQGWNRSYYSAQYDGGPRLFEGRRGWELRGRMRLHDRSGYRVVDTTCEVNRNSVEFAFLR